MASDLRIDQFDDEDKALYICGALDAIADLIAGQVMDSGVQASTLSCLMRVVGHFAHEVLDPKEGPRARPKPRAND